MSFVIYDSNTSVDAGAQDGPCEGGDGAAIHTAHGRILCGDGGGMGVEETGVETGRGCGFDA